MGLTLLGSSGDLQAAVEAATSSSSHSDLMMGEGGGRGQGTLDSLMNLGSWAEAADQYTAGFQQAQGGHHPVEGE